MIKSINADIKSDFNTLYKSQMLPVLKRYELFRQAIFNKCVMIEIAAVIVVGLLFYIFSEIRGFWDSVFGNTIAIISIIVCVVVLICVPYSSVKKFKKGLKQRCNNMLKKCFGALEWGYSEVDELLIRQSQLFGAFNRISYDDKFTGVYKQTDFSVSETEMLYIVEGKRKMVFPVFKGVILSFASNKDIQAHTIVTTKGDNSIRNYNPASWYTVLVVLPLLWTGYFDSSSRWMLFIGIGLLLYIVYDFIMKRRKLSSVKLEDLNFDKRFSVYSQNQIEARYLITPSFMERLNNLRTAFGTKKIKCAFFDDRIVFAISTPKDLFELGNFHRSLLDKKKVKEFYDEIMAIYNMIDYFKLSEKTGL